jgi:cytochrome b6-f complex iron-sulfur subunit
MIGAGILRFLASQPGRRRAATVEIGAPSSVPKGEVSPKWLQTDGLYVVRDETGLYVLKAECTHLGCVPKWLGNEQKFKCTCHGSGFSIEGDNLEGPAPRALERLKIEIDELGRIVVDKSVSFRRERNEWSRPGAQLRFVEK